MRAARWPDYPSCYFNQAGSGPARPAARARATQVDDQLAALGAHSAAGLDLVDSTLDACRATLQRALGLPTDWTVSFAQSATDALNLLAEGVRRLRGRLAASDQEHPSGILSLVVQQRRGFHVRLVPSEPRTSWSERIAEARAEADLVLVSSVSYRSGWRFPVEELSPSTDQGGLLVVDVSQALGQIDLAPIWGVADAAVGLGHKWLHGPLPSGFLLTSPRARDRLDVPRGGWHARDSSSGLAANWRQDGRLYEPGSPDGGRVAGLQVALECLSELQSQAAGQHVARLRSQVLASLEEVGWTPLPGSVPGMIFVPVPRNETARRAAVHFARPRRDCEGPECARGAGLPADLAVRLPPAQRGRQAVRGNSQHPAPRSGGGGPDQGLPHQRLSVRWTQRSDGIAIEAADYSLIIPQQAPHIEVRLLQHHAFQLNIGSALDTVEGTDTWTAPGAPFVRRHGPDAIDIEWSAASERWPAKTIELRAMEGGFSYGYTVRGSADIEAAHFFRTLSVGSPFEFAELFNPEPNCQRVRLTGAHEPALISVGNRAEQHGGNWFYTPAPFCFAIRVGHSWLSLGIAAQPGRWMFDELVYAGDGFGLTLNYGGRERVDSEWVSPRVLCYPADTPYAALARYCEALRVEGLTSRRESTSAAAWWREPVFCGWGEQVALEAVRTVPAAAHATQRNYVRWLAHLESQDIHPGTVVVDDKWQAAYGLNEPDPERWPDLKGFIAEQHSAGRRVLLWLKAWDAEGVPSDECIQDADGTPLAVDPGNPAYVRRLADQVRRMLVSLGADGFKIDFTQSIPTRRDASVSRAGWGLELQRALLAIVSGAARDARPDVMLVAHAANPYLADLFDVLRLNDLPAWCDPDDDHDAVPEMRHRAAVARAAAPNWLLESDNWPFRGRRQWRDYLSAQATGELGIPSLYYAQHLSWGSRVEALDERDYTLIRQSWEQYRSTAAYVGRGRV